MCCFCVFVLVFVVDCVCVRVVLQGVGVLMVHCGYAP